MRLAWSDDPEIYAGRSVAIRRVCHAGPDIGDDLDKKGYPGPPGCWTGVWLRGPTHRVFSVGKLLDL